MSGLSFQAGDDRAILSGYCACIDFSAPPPAPTFQRLSEWLQRRGRDGIDNWSDSTALLVHAHFWTTPEEVGERQPAESPDGRLRIVAWARLDNRAELLARLGSADLTAAATDAQLILAAYRRWDQECVTRLEGDFSFAVWDAEAQSLLCARDALGVRPLHYAAEAGRIIVGTEVGAVLAGLGARPPTNIPFLEDLLASQWERYVHETAYQGIFRLPPGYLLQFGRSGAEIRRWWNPSIDRVGRAEAQEAHLCQFRELLSRAVRNRLRSRYSVGISLSGGLDSSSIACLANELLGKADPGLPPARLYTAAFQETPGADEREFSSAVTQRCTHLQAVQVPADDCWALKEFAADGNYPLDEPEVLLNRGLLLRIARAAAGDGCRVALSGYGGDQALCGDAYFLPHLARDLTPAELRRELPHFHRRSRRPVWWIIATAFALPCLPNSWRVHLERGLRRTEAAGPGLPLRAPSAAPLMLSPSTYGPRLATAAAREIYRQVSRGSFLAELSDLSVAGLESGVEWRLPFLDRKLIELMLTLPAGALYRNGASKRTVRESLRGSLPEPVRTRSGHAHFSELVQRGLRDQECERRKRLLLNPRIASLGLVNPQRLQSAWDAWEEDPDRYCTRALYSSLLAESWLRAIAD